VGDPKKKQTPSRGEMREKTYPEEKIGFSDRQEPGVPREKGKSDPKRTTENANVRTARGRTSCLAGEKRHSTAVTQEEQETIEARKSR